MLCVSVKGIANMSALMRTNEQKAAKMTKACDPTPKFFLYVCPLWGINKEDLSTRLLSQMGSARVEVPVSDVP